ncbi:hypothetical protein RHGRI_024237 [Rhododendron griersonianum]|uniref:Uncharacterized protein n=1 Tax=Rhododendron griersonianum TaxID=479676 RepID=A0AAV6JAR2_9ERIC|nr:hypothetical protein RHGRI_024237 [Rhododendron griersonianum]
MLDLLVDILLGQRIRVREGTGESICREHKGHISLPKTRIPLLHTAQMDLLAILFWTALAKQLQFLGDGVSEVSVAPSVSALLPT